MNGMQPRSNLFSMIGLAVIMIATACTPKATPQPVDPNVMSTAIAQAASVMLTETSAAYTPTSAATDTAMPSPTEAATVASTANATPKPPTIGNFTGCWFGPGPTYILESNISKGKRVEVLGVGNVPGWYIIRNPYFHKPCWVQAADLEIDPSFNVSVLPVMTPGP